MAAAEKKFSNQVLIITCKEDLHPTPVIRKLRSLGRRVFRLNTEDLLSGYEVTLAQGDDGDQLAILDRSSGRRLELGEVGSIWFRRPLPPAAPVSIVDDAQAALFAETESESFLRAMYPLLKDRFWLSPPWVLNFEKSKIIQASVARRIGMRTPETVFTNDTAQAVAFARRHGRIALKALGARSFSEAGQHRVFFTTMVDAENLEKESDGISQSMNFLQCAVPKAYELRVTVVGSQIFSARLDSQLVEGIARDDWRRVDPDKIPYSREKLPPALESQIFQFLDAFDLSFGCFDFIVTPQNEYVFLECNGNGQWLWIENLAGLPISEAIADLLHVRCESIHPDNAPGQARYA